MSAIYQLLVDDTGLIVSATDSNLAAEGAVEVDVETYDAAVSALASGRGARFREGVVVLQPLAMAPLVDRERDRRMLLPFVFAGVLYDGDEVSQSRIEKARLSALAAVAAGAQLGDFEWPGTGLPFAWIAADNMPRPMDAQTTVAFGSVPVAREGLLIMAARAIKDRILAGEQIDDVTEDALWQLPT